MEMTKKDREYAAWVLTGLVEEKEGRGCANPCIDCDRDGKGCRMGGSFEWKYSGIMRKLIEVLKTDPVIGDGEES